MSKTFFITGANSGFGFAISAVHLDLNDPQSLQDAARDLGERFPTLNVVIANAGISRTEDMTSGTWNVSSSVDMIQTNIVGVISTVAAFLPVLKAQRNATIMATSSALAFLPRADFATYCASKAFLHSWLTSLRHQLRKLPIEVLEPSPPYVRTELTGLSQAANPRAMPLASYICEVMSMLENGQHPRGELLLERDQSRRLAERDGTFDSIFAAMNPA